VSLHVPGADEFPIPFFDTAADAAGIAAGLSVDVERWLADELLRQLDFGPARLALDIRIRRVGVQAASEQDVVAVAQPVRRRVPRRAG
jgi:hypothetical protein